MAQQNKPVLGVDFGTTNSYFCKFMTHPDGHKIRLIDFGNGQLGGLASTILYRKNRSAIVGNPAEEEWGEATSAEKKQYDLHTHFKPDVARSKEAATDATAYLQTIREEMSAKRVDFVSENHQIIVGIPGEADADFQNAVKVIFKEAGYGEVRLMAEPVGAMLYHLWNKDITPAQTQSGVLVVDFGGGTCDFAFMQRLEVCHAWGDMLLGGRLFDDLFFQWFLDQNPNALQELSKSGDEYFVHWLECRKAKELFSETMRRSKTEQTRHRMGRMRSYGTLTELNWEEFVNRAKNYTPHSTFIQYLKERNLQNNVLTSGKPVDLLNWFETALRDGLEKYNIRNSDIERVILTGGSSQWSFVEEIVCEALHVSPDILLTSENPKAAISEGLVVFPALKNTYERVSNNLQNGLPKFFSEEIEPEINQRLDIIINDILNDIAVRLFDEKIAPLIYDYRNSGGPLKTLKEKVKSVTLAFAPQIEDNVQQKLNDLNAGLPFAIFKKIRIWFEENGVSYFGSEVKTDFIEKLNTNATENSATEKISDIQRETMDLTSVLVIAITSTIVGTITGGTGGALIASGPAGWIIGAVGTAAAMWITYEFGRDKLNEYIEQVDLPSTATKLILRDSKIKAMLKDGREKLKAELLENIEDVLEKPLNDMKRQTQNGIQTEIRNLTMINHL